MFGCNFVFFNPCCTGGWWCVFSLSPCERVLGYFFLPLPTGEGWGEGASCRCKSPNFLPRWRGQSFFLPSSGFQPLSPIEGEDVRRTGVGYSCSPTNSSPNLLYSGKECRCFERAGSSDFNGLSRR